MNAWILKRRMGLEMLGSMGGGVGDCHFCMEQGLPLCGGHIPGALRGWFEAGISEWGKDSVGNAGHLCLPNQGQGSGSWVSVAGRDSAPDLKGGGVVPVGAGTADPVSSRGRITPCWIPDWGGSGGGSALPQAWLVPARAEALSQGQGREADPGSLTETWDPAHP